MLGTNEQILNALDRARTEHEDLAELLVFYRDLMAIQFEAGAHIPVHGDRPDEGVVLGCLANGLPQLTFDQLAIEPEAFVLLVEEIMGVLMRHRPDPGQMTETNECPAPEKLMRLAEEIYREKAPAAQAELSASGAIPLAVEFALAPYLERAAEALMPQLDLNLWQRGYCPLCGAAPDFAFLDEESGARHLVCPRCNTQWRYVRLKCPFCKTTDHTKLQYYPSDDHVYRLYVCELCKHYIKTIDLRVARKKVLLPVERIVTVAMDVAAQEKSYTAG